MKEFEDKLLDKYRGCLIGGAVGDALGYAVEFLSESSIAKAYGEKDLEILAQRYVEKQEQGVANVQMVLNLASMASGFTYFPILVLNNDFTRPVMRSKPFSNAPVSPVWNHPSLSITSAVKSGAL